MKLLATLGAFLFSGIVAATPLHNIVVFGDSLSDNGNLYEIMKHQLPQSPPYFEGRFSNGPVWAEHLILSYFSVDPLSHLQDYAIGGTGVSDEEDEDDDDALFSLKKQIDQYLLANNDKASDDNLYVLWIGANNYLGMPTEVEETLTMVNAGIARNLKRLIDKGAKHILVFNLPDLGRSPAAIDFGSIEMFTYFANKHNENLYNTVADLKQQYPDVEWVYFDMNSMFNHVLENAADYGFTNITETCAKSSMDEKKRRSLLNMVSSTKAEKENPGCEGYLFFDLIHPTALAHQIIAEKTRIVLDEAGVKFSE